jgi:hypothetical protein
MQMLWSMQKAMLPSRHMVFQKNDRNTYSRSILEALSSASLSATPDAVLS